MDVSLKGRKALAAKWSSLGIRKLLENELMCAPIKLKHIVGGFLRFHKALMNYFSAERKIHINYLSAECASC